MLVTIYTDMSLDVNGNAAYAFRAKSEKGLLTGGDMITIDNPTTNKAEYYAIRMAMWAVVNKWNNVTCLFINTDCRNACVAHWKMAELEGFKTTMISRDLKEDVHRVVNWFKQKDIALRFKHVKAHQSNTHDRAWLNNWCDRQAKLIRHNKANNNGIPQKSN